MNDVLPAKLWCWLLKHDWLEIDRRLGNDVDSISYECGRCGMQQSYGQGGYPEKRPAWDDIWRK